MSRAVPMEFAAELAAGSEIQLPLQRAQEMMTALRYLEGEAKRGRMNELALWIGMSVLAAEELVCRLSPQQRRQRKGRAPSGR